MQHRNFNHMKYTSLLVVVTLTTCVNAYTQTSAVPQDQGKAISEVISQYATARENRDTVLLKTILEAEVGQLVSTGEWRDGIASAVDGMMKSSAAAPGTRTLNIQKMRLLNPAAAIVDCKYNIQNQDGSIRGMWSTFLLVASRGNWKISAIRNMLPASN